LPPPLPAVLPAPRAGDTVLEAACEIIAPGPQQRFIRLRVQPTHTVVFFFLFNQPQPALPGFGIEERHTNIDPFITQRAGSVTHDPVKRTRSPNTRQCCGLFWNFTT
jgi:hypothetical protein